ncbi:MAG: hypothetical protein PF489_06500, partial [Salinivirgaceae bacterium]|nr:hypothetical protein [Salinivirgaceae bacterium]
MNSKNFSWLLITLFFALKLNGAETISPFEAGLPAICYSENDFPEHDTSEMDLNQYIDMLKRVVEENNRYVGFLSADRIYQLPIGLHKNIGGVDFTIVLDNLRIDAGGGWISAYMTIELPGANERVGLYADNVRITKNGIQTAQLKMIQDRALDIGGFTLKLKQDETLVQWNCNGYESTTIGGELIFNNELLIPVLPDGTPEPSLPLVGEFLVSFEDLNNIMAGIDLPDFQISGLPDMTFSTGETMLDMSDFDNPENQSFPDGFFEGSYNTDMANLWRGVYIHSFSVQLPEQFSNSAEGLTLGAEGLIIDNNGITGNLFAANIIGLEQGDLGGWQFSLDELGFSLMKNNFNSFQFAGQIRLPIAQEDQTFGYEGIVGDSGDMTFAIETLETMQADLWAAQLTLAQNSSVQIEKEGHEYTPSARLHGGMTVALSDEVELAEFVFEDLVISSREPHLTIGHFGMPNGVLAGFPVNV